jgi:hypothetical protein
VKIYRDRKSTSKSRIQSHTSLRKSQRLRWRNSQATSQPTYQRRCNGSSLGRASYSTSGNESSRKNKQESMTLKGWTGKAIEQERIYGICILRPVLCCQDQLKQEHSQKQQSQVSLPTTPSILPTIEKDTKSSRVRWYNREGQSQLKCIQLQLQSGGKMPPITPEILQNESYVSMRIHGSCGEQAQYI